MGTPDFAAVVLDAVLSSGAARISAVYTQPDRPCGRGQSCQPSAVKRLALACGLPVRQPVNFKDPSEVQALVALAPDVLLVAAYGLILPLAVLDAARVMPVNVHASLLPKYRGAAPIQRAILNGETRTGITIMRMEAGLDTGPMLLSSPLDIGPDETAGQLHDRLAALGGELLVQALGKLRQGGLTPTPQDDAQASYAAKLAKHEARIDWTRPAREVHDRIRAMAPRPGAFFTVDLPGTRDPLRLIASPGAIGQPKPAEIPPGRVLGLVDDHLAIACRDNLYLLGEIRPSGKKPMDARSFACGYLNRLDPALPLDCQPDPGLLA